MEHDTVDSSLSIQIESLEREIAELEALQAIYGNDAQVQSSVELEAALLLLSNSSSNNDIADDIAIPQLEVSIKNIIPDVRLHCKLPPGYPVTSAAVVHVVANNSTLSRQMQDKLSSQLQTTANARVGNEVVMELVHELQEIIMSEEETNEQQQQQPADVKTATITAAPNSIMHQQQKRCWVWAHHITNTDRCKSIVEEARALNLQGYLKPGYPGIVLVQGAGGGVDEFCTWIKGSKSRPGGFGCNWGHHVKGEIEFFEEDGDDDQSSKLPVFQQLDESMKELAALCKAHGLEDEFREFVLQHKPVSITGS